MPTPKPIPLGWHSPAPRIGSKRAFAGHVAALIQDFAPDAIVVPFGGTLGELHGTAPSCRVAAAEVDPATRSVLEAGAQGLLTQAAADASTAWVDALRAVDFRDEEQVRKTFFKLREGRHPFTKPVPPPDPGTLAAPPRLPLDGPAWTILMSACAISGHWRRNEAGDFNIAMGQYRLGWALDRITPAPYLQAADAWASALVQGRPRLSVHVDAFALLERLKRPTRQPVRVFLSVDPPYGQNEEVIYQKAWTKDSIHDLVHAVSELPRHDHLTLAGVIWGDERHKAAWEQSETLAIEWVYLAGKKRIGKGMHLGSWMGTFRTLSPQELVALAGGDPEDSLPEGNLP